MTRTIILTLLLCAVPWTVRGQVIDSSRGWDDGIRPIPLPQIVPWPSMLDILDSLYAPTPTPTVRVRIETLHTSKSTECDDPGCLVNHLRRTGPTIQIDSVFGFLYVDTIWVKEEE